MNTVEVYFDDINIQIISELETAEREVTIVMGWIRLSIFFHCFDTLLDKGVKLNFILDTNNKFKKSNQPKISLLEAKKATFQYIEMPRLYGVMHHKFCIIDNKTVITGSHNWTLNAQTNFENIVVIKNDQKVVDSFKKEVHTLKSMTKERIKQLQSLGKCPDCKGKFVNIAILQPEEDKYNDVIGSVVKVCLENPHDHFETIELGIVDSRISSIAEEMHERFKDAFEEYNYTDKELTENKKKEIIEQLNYDADKLYWRHSHDFGLSLDKGPVVHAVGKIHAEYYGPDGEDEDFYTSIIWKARFISGMIEDRYDGTFDTY